MNIGLNTAKILGTIISNDVDLVAHLDLSKNLIGDKGVEILAPAFQNSRNLVSLSLGSNDISGVGMVKLFNAFTLNCSLSTINLSTEDGVQRNRITSSASLEALKNFILTNKFCKVLKIKGVFLGVPGFRVIFDALCAAKRRFDQ